MGVGVDQIIETIRDQSREVDRHIESILDRSPDVSLGFDPVIDSITEVMQNDLQKNVDSAIDQVIEHRSVTVNDVATVTDSISCGAGAMVEDEAQADDKA